LDDQIKPDGVQPEGQVLPESDVLKMPEPALPEASSTDGYFAPTSFPISSAEVEPTTPQAPVPPVDLGQDNMPEVDNYHTEVEIPINTPQPLESLPQTPEVVAPEIPTEPTPESAPVIPEATPLSEVKEPQVSLPEAAQEPNTGHFTSLDHLSSVPPAEQYYVQPAATPDNMATATVMPNVEPTPAKKPFSFNKKWLVIALGGILGVGFMAGAIYFGYHYYVSSDNARILSAAAKSIANGKNMEVSFNIGASGISVDGKIYVDKNQDIKLKLDNEFFPLEAMYIKGKDTIYMKGTTYSDTGTKTDSYSAYSNITPALKKYGIENLGVDSLNPTKNYITTDNAKYFNRMADESIDGQNLYKFELVASEADIKKATEQANKKLNEMKMDTVSFKEIKNKTAIWIRKSDFSLFKVQGETAVKYSYKMKDYSKCVYSTSSKNYVPCDYNKLPDKVTEEKFDFKWGLLVKFGYNEDIALPKGAKVSSTTDLLKVEEESNKAEIRTLNRSNAMAITTGLEAYFAKNRAYPAIATKTPINKLVADGGVLKGYTTITTTGKACTNGGATATSTAKSYSVQPLDADCATAYQEPYTSY
jgi:hypothetical protein